MGDPGEYGESGDPGDSGKYYNSGKPGRFGDYGKYCDTSENIDFCWYGDSRECGNSGDSVGS